MAASRGAACRAAAACAVGALSIAASGQAGSEAGGGMPGERAVAPAGEDQPDVSELDEREPRRAPSGEVIDQPAAEGAGDVGEAVAPPGGDGGAEGDDEAIRFGPFSEGVELRALVEFAAEMLEINVAVDPSLRGSVMFNAEFEVAREELLPLINSLLEQNGFMMTEDRHGFYVVRPSENVPVGSAPRGRLTTSRVIRTPNVRPSSLAGAIGSRLGIGSDEQAQQDRLEYLDELGLILVTDTPERCDAVARVVEEVIEQRGAFEWVHLPLEHVAATVAHDRVAQLVAGAGDPSARRARDAAQQGQRGATALATGRGGVENIPDRLAVATQGNGLIFRGRPDEVEEVREILRIIDQPHSLTPRRFYTGSMTQQIAEFAAQQGLGYVTTMSAGAQAGGRGEARVRAGQNQPQQEPDAASGGPTLVVDVQRGVIVYYATPAQHRMLESLVEEFEPEDETIVIREYPLEHSNAEDVAELLRALLLDEVQTEEGGLLPQNQGGTQGARQPTGQARQFGASVEGEAAFTGDPSLVNITADPANNQLLIRAPLQQQEEIGKVLAKIDVRRPQVWIDVKIVSMTDSEEFRLAVETQLVNANGTGGLGRTNFGLSTIPDGDTITDIAQVSTGMPGLTSAVILSDQLPFVLNAIETVTDAKITSNPSLLVDDNVEAVINSIREEPTTQQSQGDATTLTSFQGFQEAGTQLTVTPRISKGGYLSLDYEIELSNFDGEGTAGVPPPRVTQNVSAESVTIPGDATIVVGGIRVTDLSETVSRVPFIGRWPLVGRLFSDTRQEVSDRILYVFITPRILNDRNFLGHRLLTEGPRQIAELAPDIPPMDIRVIPISEGSSPRRRGPVPPPPAGGIDPRDGQGSGVERGASGEGG